MTSDHQGLKAWFDATAQRRVIVVGAGSLGVMAADALLAARRCSTASTAFLDDRPELEGTRVAGIPVLGPTSLLDFVTEVGGHRTRVVIAIAANDVRAQIAARWPDLDYVNAIHPQAVVSPLSELGVGNIILPSAVIDPQASVADHVVINKASTIGHNCVVESFAQLAPGVTGSGRICEGAFVGMGANLLPGVVIGRGARIGAGAVVTRNVEAGQTVVGIPARPVETAVSTTV